METYTLRFERHDPNTGTSVSVIPAPKYDIEMSGDKIDVLVPNDQGVWITYPIGKYDGAYDRCFVMNGNGTTIDKISIK